MTNFKNYLSEYAAFSPKLNCIVGLNGMGKTNLLDAIYYSCMCKSRLAGTDRNVVRKVDGQKADFFRLDAYFQKDLVQDRIVAKVIPGDTKVFEKNGLPYDRLHEHIGQYPIIFISPDDTDLLLEGSISRRLLMDNVLSQMHREYLYNLLAYNRVLKQRNAALKQFAEQRNYSAGLLKTYNRQLAAPAGIIHQYRVNFTALFNSLLEEFYKIIAADTEQVQCGYKSTLHDDKLETTLEERVEKDRYLGYTTAGIHRDDLTFRLNDFPLKRFASQGQLKSFVLAVKLSQYEILRKHKNDKPLLLLDDIFDKLDDRRVASLLELLHGAAFGQIFLTDTHAYRAEEIIRSFSKDFKKFVIRNGTIQ